jgi:hypothetical protein
LSKEALDELGVDLITDAETKKSYLSRQASITIK